MPYFRPQTFDLRCEIVLNVHKDFFFTYIAAYLRHPPQTFEGFDHTEKYPKKGQIVLNRNKTFWIK